MAVVFYLQTLMFFSFNNNILLILCYYLDFHPEITLIFYSKLLSHFLHDKVFKNAVRYS